MSRTGHDVVLARHGQTEWSLDGRHTGTTDIPLTAEGREHARALAPRLKDWSFALVLSSPLTRALDTARLAGLGGAMSIREDLREWDYGSYEGVSTPDIHKTDPGWYLFTDGCPGGETPAQVGTRVDRVIAELRAADGPCAVFAHGHVLRVLAARWLGFDPAESGRFALSTATLSVLGEEHHHPAVWLWNDGSHFD